MNKSLIEIDRLQNNTKYFDKLVIDVKTCTDWNDHNKARLLIAAYFGHDKYVNLFTSISFIAKTLGYVSLHLLNFREEITKEMLFFIKDKYGKTIHDILYNCL